ncbi:UvrD-helicase domain-containing protein, partial [Ideonella livida]
MTRAPRLPDSAAPAADGARPLRPLDFPLHGAQLIEASAGTGKTWTIAALYLRLVLGHGLAGSDPQTATAYPGGPLLPGQILVMTFTRAATRELSDRIRARLLEAARAFRAADEEGAPAPADPLLAGLLQAYPEPAARIRAAWRLAQAAEAMDESAIHTIDAWCQRMLREHAFDSGSLFDEELVPDEAELLAQAARDYWRQQVYPLDDAALGEVLKVWSGVPALLEDARQLLALPPEVLDPDDRPVPALRGLLTERAQALRPLMQQAGAQLDTLAQWLLAEMETRPRDWDGRSFKPAQVRDWLERLQAWARAEDSPDGVPLHLPDLGSGKDRGPRTHWFTVTGLQAVRNAKAGPLGATPPCLDWWQQVLDTYDGLPPLAVGLRQAAARAMARRLADFKRQRGQFGFADLQQRLAAALAGPAGARLRHRIVTQTPVALIDEFQDTSALQFGLFDALYGVTREAVGAGQEPAAPATALLLIGDPKQSIYRFRGADIDSYLRTRAATAGHHHRLDTNHRSTTAVVEAVNSLFGRGQAVCPAGAFDYRPPGGGDDPLPFQPVRARGRAEVLGHAHAPLPALTVVHTLAPARGEPLRRAYAERCAAQVVAWLNAPDLGFRPAAGGPGPLPAGVPAWQRLRPADIAILVRTGTEAAAVRRALAARQVASVFLSDRDSVLASPEAADLLLWLQAVAEPQDVRRVRTALATRLAGLELAELVRLAEDDDLFDQRAELLRALHQVWRTQGVLPMLRQTLHRLDLPARWLAQPGGERPLTNLLHLAELLQSASRTVEGEQALIRWLALQREALAQGQTPGGDDALVRLESDADLVKVVTIHKSKGLEYPVVMLPFATLFRPVEARGTRHLLRAGADGRPELVLDPDVDDLAAADRERLREDLRLCYVALTRASHALWLGVAAVQQGQAGEVRVHRSALGHLLTGGQPVDGAGLGQALADWAAACPQVVLQPAAAPEA